MKIECQKQDDSSHITLKLDHCLEIKLILSAEEMEILEDKLLDMQIALSIHRREHYKEKDIK